MKKESKAITAIGRNKHTRELIMNWLYLVLTGICERDRYNGRASPTRDT